MKKIMIVFYLVSLPLLADNFWQSFDRALKESVIYYNYSSVDGDFYHTGVDYEKIQKTPALVELLKKQRQQLIDYKLSSNYLSKPLAFWINCYNFFTIVDVVTKYPIDSMKSDIGWDNKHHNIGGIKFTLNDIEHKIIRKYNDARIHFAINCASVGCPALINSVFQQDKLDEQLNAIVKNSLINPLHLYKDTNGKRYWHTKLFSWFEEDFKKPPYDSVNNFVIAFAPSKYKNIDSMSSVSYDWNLNKPDNILKKLRGIQKKYAELKLIQK